MGQRLKHFLKAVLRFILYPLSFPFIEYFLKKKIEKNPNDYKSLWNLAICYFVFERYLEAQAKLEVLIKIRPEPSYIKYLSRVYFRQEKYNKVVEVISNPGILSDKDKENFYLGYSLFHLREYYGAIKYFSKYVKYYPKDYVFEYLGYSYQMEQMYDLSLEAYREAEKLNPSNKEIKHNIILCIEMINERQLNGELTSPGPMPQVN